MEYTLRELDVKQIRNSSILIIGKNSSSIVLDYLHNNQDIGICTIISSKPEIYKHSIPTHHIHNKYTPNITANFSKHQQNLAKFYHQKGQNELIPRSILVLDNCLTNNNDSSNPDLLPIDKSIRWIIMNGIFVKITLIITIPTSMQFPQQLQNNLNYIFICNESDTALRRKIYEHYGSSPFPTFVIFNKFLESIVSNDDYDRRRCMIIDNNTISDKLEDIIRFVEMKKI